MREFRSAKMGRGRDVQGCYGSARQKLAASVPRLSVPPPPGIWPLGFHAGKCRWATTGMCVRRGETTVRFVLGIAGKGEIEY